LLNQKFNVFVGLEFEIMDEYSPLLNSDEATKQYSSVDKNDLKEV